MIRVGLRAAAGLVLLAISWHAFATTGAGNLSQPQAPSAQERPTAMDLRLARNFAPGFSTRAAGSKLVIVPADVELFSTGLGGVAEPRADWTEAAQKHFRNALLAHKLVKDSSPTELTEAEVNELGQLNALHGTVAEAVFVHHLMGMPQLPTKGGLLDWTLGDAVQPLRQKTQADYALFLWVRDSYATAERKAATVAVALLLGVYVPGGVQVAYASLVDLRDGRIVWFNHLGRGTGDLRDAEPARETVDALLWSFPAAR